jgi:hypothetical protein
VPDAPNSVRIAALAARGEDDGSRPRLDDIVNFAGLTPLTLAASLGNRDQFCDIWGSRARLLWKWGGVTARAFPLDQIDDIGGRLRIHLSTGIKIDLDPIESE